MQLDFWKVRVAAGSLNRDFSVVGLCKGNVTIPTPPPT